MNQISQTQRFEDFIREAAANNKLTSMFMEVLRIEPEMDLVYLELMQTGPDGSRPEVDGELLSITLPLSQFEPLMESFVQAFASDAYLRRQAHRSPGIG